VNVREPAVSLRSRCRKTWCLQRHPDTAFREIRTMFGVMAPPRAVVVVKVMIWICGVDPQRNFRWIHNGFCSAHQELLEKQKTANPSGRRFQSSGGDLFGEFPHHTSSGTFVPDQGHLSSPLPGCQTRIRVVPDVAWDRIITAARGKNNLCHSKIAARLVHSVVLAWAAEEEKMAIDVQDFATRI
jgi:hypothetical protein